MLLINNHLNYKKDSYSEGYPAPDIGNPAVCKTSGGHRKTRDNIMDVRCPKCGTGYRVAESKIHEKGTYARCPKCRSRFLVKKNSEKADEQQTLEKICGYCKRIIGSPETASVRDNSPICRECDEKSRKHTTMQCDLALNAVPTLPASLKINSEKETKTAVVPGVRASSSLRITSLFSVFSKDMAIDLGTANTLIYMKQKGIVLNEPSVVAIHESPGMRKQILAIGMDAKKMIGKVPPNIKAVRPMRNGVIADFEVAGVMLRYFIAKVRTGLRLFRPRIIVAVPSGISSVEKRAVKEIGYEAGGREVFLVEEPMAAAIGADVSVIDPVCSMVVDIGGGTTDIAVISLAGIVSGRSLRIAGDKMDLSIQRYIRKKYSFDIGERTAEEIKISIGNAEPDPLYPKIMEVKGWDLVSEKFRIITVNDLEIREAISEQIDSIVETVKMVLDRTSQELTADIVEKGIILTGGVALLKNMNKFFEKEIGLPIRVPENPLTTVALGSGRLLDDPDLLRRVSVV